MVVAAGASGPAQELLGRTVAVLAGEMCSQFRCVKAVELKSTFASHYAKEVSLAEALHLDEIAVYGRRATGEKYLISPKKAISR